LPVEDTGISFSASEARLLLSDTSAADVRTETGIRAKLAWLGQPYREDAMGRNLRAPTQSGSFETWSLGAFALFPYFHQCNLLSNSNRSESHSDRAEPNVFADRGLRKLLKINTLPIGM
jgi:hypothetical protein